MMCIEARGRDMECRGTSSRRHHICSLSRRELEYWMDREGENNNAIICKCNSDEGRTTVPGPEHDDKLQARPTLIGCNKMWSP